MKKIISLMLVVVMAIVMLTGCGAKTPQGNAVSLIDTTAEDIVVACDEGMHTSIAAVLLDKMFIICDGDKAMNTWLHNPDKFLDNAVIDDGAIELKDGHCLSTSASMPLKLSDAQSGTAGAYSRAMHMYLIDVFVYPDGNYCVVRADGMV